MRYICGGEEGRDARGSGTEGAVGVGEVVEMMGVVEGTLYWISGGGAPLTSWSRFDIVCEVR